MQLFSEEWLAAASSALRERNAELGEVDAVIDYVVAGGPDGKIIIGVTVAGGVVSAIASGKSDAPDIVVSLKYPVAVEILTGVSTSDAAFMTGAIKVEGDHASWMLDLRGVRLGAIEALSELMANTES